MKIFVFSLFFLLILLIFLTIPMIFVWNSIVLGPNRVGLRLKHVLNGRIMGLEIKRFCCGSDGSVLNLSATLDGGADMGGTIRIGFDLVEFRSKKSSFWHNLGSKNDRIWIVSWYNYNWVRFEIIFDWFPIQK